jgi:ribose 1,5-bisphosphokinase PhnN
MKLVIGDMTKEQMQERIQQIIREQEEEIERLLERKKQSKAGDMVFVVCEISVLQKQKFIAELRALL